MNIDESNVSSNIIPVLFMILSIVVIYSASQFPDEGEVGTGFFPILVSVGIILSSIVNILTDNVDDSYHDISSYNLISAAIVFTIMVLYVILMPIIGFLIGTMILLPVLMYYSGVQSKSLIAAISVIFPIVLFYIFSRIFLVPLPEAIIPVSRLLPDLPLGGVL